MKRKNVIESDSDEEVVKPAAKRQSLGGGKSKKVELVGSSDEDVKPVKVRKKNAKREPSVSHGTIRYSIQSSLKPMDVDGEGTGDEADEFVEDDEVPKQAKKPPAKKAAAAKKEPAKKTTPKKAAAKPKKEEEIDEDAAPEDKSKPKFEYVTMCGQVLMRQLSSVPGKQDRSESSRLEGNPRRTARLLGWSSVRLHRRAR